MIPNGKSLLNHTMKTLTINGVPYTVNESGDVFVYSSSPPISIGTYDTTTKTLKLHEDWQARMEEWVAHYRTGLKEETDAALEKAKQLQAAS